jgi:hypothetical protein
VFNGRPTRPPRFTAGCGRLAPQSDQVFGSSKPFQAQTDCHHLSLKVEFAWLF